jgi:TfoX/Sxy family transcriptional regulator of competence genes
VSQIERFVGDCVIVFVPTKDNLLILRDGDINIHIPTAQTCAKLEYKDRKHVFKEVWDSSRCLDP